MLCTQRNEDTCNRLFKSLIPIPNNEKLPGSRATNDSDFLSGRNDKREVVEYRPTINITEAHVFKFDFGIWKRQLQFFSAGCVL